MKHLNLTPALYEYMLSVSLDEEPILRQLREETAKMPLGKMQVAPEQAQFMQFLIRLMGARRILELGTFTGYSALAMAFALPEDGLVITCDNNPEWTRIADSFWRKANQEKKIQLRLAPALESLEQLMKENQHFDFIFIDADKTNYLNYYELALQLISPRGIIAIDNVFWGGKIIDKSENDAQTREIRRLNARIQQDNRVYTSLLPIADGLFLAMPR